MKKNNLMMKLIVLLLLSVISASMLLAQVEERSRPEEWKNLVYGGRFMDRFMPIPINGELTDDTWGADAVIPRYVDNGIEDNINSYWGGNVIKGDDGKYHLFVCGWPENSPKGHMFWRKSTVYHAIADNSFGPYHVKRSIGPGHNPTAFKTSDGKFIIYIIDGYYVSDSINGPWEYKKFDFDPRDRQIIEGLSNVTFAQREDGSYLAVCRGGGIWFSQTGESEYYQVSDKRVYPPVQGRFEDPVIWRTNVQYHMIVNDWLGRIAWYLRSKDGINWKVDSGEAYLPGIAIYEDGTKEDWFKFERMRVLQDEYGRATQAHFAVIDTLKECDREYDNHSSKHIIIPLTVGKLISVLNPKGITSKTKKIEVKVLAEEGFNPQTDVDFNSLRFGAPEVVDFGKGSKLIESKVSGDDLILVFDGEGNGITKDNFAGKLLGRTTDGKLLFGYSRLPGVCYIEPILSARKPVIKGEMLEVEVQNFGQINSFKSAIKITLESNGKSSTLATGNVPALKPFEKATLSLTPTKTLKKGAVYKVQVIISSKSFNPVDFCTELEI